MNDNDKKMIVSVIYRSLSQNNCEFDSFLLNFEQLLSDISIRKPTVSIITGDLNARSSSWWSDDINTQEGTNLYLLTFSNGFSQLINEQALVKTNGFFCIYLIFTDQSDLSVNSGVHAYLHPNYHHQTVHTSFNLNISYPPPHYTSVLYGITKRKTLKKLEMHLIWQTGRGFLVIKILTHKFQFLMKLY